MTLVMRKSFRPLRGQAPLPQDSVRSQPLCTTRTLWERSLPAKRPEQTTKLFLISALCPILMLLQVGLGQVATRRHATGQPDIAADGGAAADGDPSEDGRPGIDHHVVLDNRVTRMALLQLPVLVRREALGTEGHRLVDAHP